MLSNDLTQIIILNPVRINYTLNKWASKQGEPLTADEITDVSLMPQMQSFGNEIVSSLSAEVWDGVPFSVRREFRSPFWRSVFNSYIKFRLLFQKPNKNPVDFFIEVKDNFIELQKSDIPPEKFKQMLNQLEKSGQRLAMVNLNTQKKITDLENALVEAGINQYQTEESIIKFIRQCEKGLCLTEIEYFERVIPEDVMQKLDGAEELKVFDNYYILHHDPKKVDNKFYTKPPPPKRDPILFGVIRGSNKLYFVADWIYEFCSLTYKDILKQGIDYKLEKQ